MGWKQWTRDYLSFTRKDRIAILVLVLVIASVFFLPEILPPVADPKPATTDTSWIATLKKLEQKTEYAEETRDKSDEENSTAYQYDRPASNDPHKPRGELFYFDPNTLPAAEWKRLGLRDKTIRTIQNYLSKGGQFRRPEDLKKIYGLFPDEYERIAPYIRMAASGAGNPKDAPVTDPPPKQPEKTYPPKYTAIDINEADTTAWIALPGIGSKLAARIVNFRDKLGGFYAVYQVGETYGLPDSAFQKIKPWLQPGNKTIRKININTATVDELKVHPYIRFAIANAIITFRNEHGLFSNVDDIRKIMAVTDELFKKVAPYLTTEK